MARLTEEERLAKRERFKTLLKELAKKQIVKPDLDAEWLLRFEARQK